MEWDIRPKLKCTKCGGKAVGLIYTPDASPCLRQGQGTGDSRHERVLNCLNRSV